jgi:hypothetical protein
MGLGLGLSLGLGLVLGLSLGLGLSLNLNFIPGMPRTFVSKSENLTSKIRFYEQKQDLAPLNNVYRYVPWRAKASEAVPSHGAKNLLT